MGMKEAFETFFEEMTQNSIEKTGFPPKLPCYEAKRPTDKRRIIVNSEVIEQKMPLQQYRYVDWKALIFLFKLKICRNVFAFF